MSTTVKITKCTASQVAAAKKYLPTGLTAGAFTLEWSGTTADELVASIRAMKLGRADEGSVALASVRRRLEALDVTPAPKAASKPKAEKAPEPGPEPEAIEDAPAFDPDPRVMVQQAKLEWAELREWSRAGEQAERPATPNLDELNRQYSAGQTASKRKGSSSTRAAKQAQPKPELHKGQVAMLLRSDGWGEKVANHAGELAVVTGQWMVYEKDEAQALFDQLTTSSVGAPIFEKRVIDYVSATILLSSPKVTDSRTTTHAKMLAAVRQATKAGVITSADVEARSDGTLTIALHTEGGTFDNLTQRGTLAKLAELAVEAGVELAA